jgi:GntR family transcriptional regulator / MocR family aminotransferase
MPRTRTSSATELLVELRRDDPLPLHGQLEQELRRAIRVGRLPDDSVLPSTRALADQLGVSRGVVVEAYEQLVAEGYLSSQPGGTTRVCAKVMESAPPPSARRSVSIPRINFGYGRPDVTEFPRQVWLRSLRRVLNEAPSERMSYLDDRGAPELREALATYLNRVRGTAADAERIVICNGFAQALGLVTLVLAANGRTRIGVEDPGQRDAIRSAGVSGLEAVPIPVDDDGIDVGALRRADPDAVILTPAHHFPTGAVLSAERRAAIVAWAKERDRLILEDDYDAEFRYDREPIGAIHGLAPEQVVYAGSASKTLAPGLRLGWLIIPTKLVDQLASTKEATDRGSASLEQLAFADFLSRGEFDRHLRRMRPIYRLRRDALLAALRRHLPELRPVGASAGLHVLAWMPSGVDEAALVQLAAESGVAVDGLTPYRKSGDGLPGGLLFGYGTVTEAGIDEGVRIIAEVMDRARTGQAQSGASVAVEGLTRSRSVNNAKRTPSRAANPG